MSGAIVVSKVGVGVAAPAVTVTAQVAVLSVAYTPDTAMSSIARKENNLVFIIISFLL